MAAIGYIQRVLMPVVIVVIMLAIVAFLFMDVSGLGGGGGLFGGGPERTEFAVINGEPINAAAYDNELNVAYQKHVAFQNVAVQHSQRQYSPEPQQMYQIEEQAWTSYINEEIMGARLGSLGLTVTDQEYADLVFGPEPHQYIQALYQGYLGTPTYDPNNPTAMESFVSTIQNQELWQQNPAYIQAYYDYVAREHEMRRQVKYDKYTQLLQKSSYTPTWLAEQDYTRGSAKRKVSFIKLPYTDIADTEIDITNEAELQALYNEKLKTFTPVEETRTVQYISFPIVPTAEDTAKILATNTDYLNTWKTEGNDSTFLSIRSQGPERFNRIYRTQKDLYNLFVDSAKAEEIFAMEPNSFTEPFYEPGVFRSVKLVERAVYPDSSSLRVILIPKEGATELEEDFNAADTVSSILARLEAGESFAELATAYSVDQSRAAGGELGWVGPNSFFPGIFKDYYLGSPELNTPTVLETDLAYNIVEVTERKNMEEYVNILQLVTNVVPSRSTVDSVNKEAERFYEQYTSSQENFEEGISTLGLNKRISPKFGKNEFNIAGIPQSGDVITWAYTSEDEFNFYDKDDRLLIVKKGEYTEAGPPPMSEVLTQLESDLRRDKKAEILLENAKKATSGQTDINAIATSLGATVSSTEAVNLSASSDPSMGPEPYVIGTAFGLGLNEISEPIKGVTGVFILTATEDIPAIEQEDFSINATRLNTQLANRFNLNAILEMSRDKMDIEDNRRITGR